MFCGKKNESVGALQKNVAEEHSQKHQSKSKSSTNKTEDMNKIPSMLKTADESHRNMVNNCQHCPSTFKKLDELKEHLSIHALGDECVCHICNDVFSNEANLKKHIKSSHENSRSSVSTYECTECEQTFSAKKDLMNHVIQMHSPMNEDFNCNIC